jgi:hypothetical protein
MQKIYGKSYDRFEQIEAFRRYRLPRCTVIKVEIRAGEPDVDRNLHKPHRTAQFERQDV